MKLNTLDLNKLPVFCAVMDGGGFREASERLLLTRSAISQSIASLEASLRVPLFKRVGRRLIPTDAAFQLYRGFSTSQRNLESLLRELRGDTVLPQGTIRVGAYSEFTKTLLMAPLADFARQYPEIQFRFQFDAPSRLQEQLQNGNIDVAFSIYPSRDRKQLRSTRLFEEQLILVGRKEHLSPSPQFEELLATPIIDYYQNHILMKRWMKHHFSKSPKHIDIRMYAASADMVLRCVREGLGIGVVPHYVMTSESMEHLVVARPQVPQLKDYIWLIEHHSLPKKGAVPLFTEFIRQVF